MKQARTSVTTLVLAVAASLITLSGATSAAEDVFATSLTGHHVPYLNEGAWINDVGALLSADPDADGYFSALSLSIDADSNYHQYSVYVIIDIVNEFNEAELFHTTRNFEVYERSISDEYRIDIDLVRNYSPGIYDLRIILVDAYDNRILDQVDASDFRNLRSLPLESSDNQAIHTPVSDLPVTAPNDDIQVSEYAGSTGFGSLSLLVISILCRLCGNRHLPRKE